MGRQIRTNGDKWEVFSTISDTVVATFDSKQEIAQWMAKDELYRGKLKAIETLMTFPAHWVIDGKYNNGSSRKYYSWIEGVYDRAEKGEGNWYEMVDKKFDELMEGAK